MNKVDLANAVAQKTKLTKTKAWEVVNATFESIRASLKEGHKVSVVGFGSFRVKSRRARTGRNPKTGKPMEIQARRVPAFTAGSTLRQFLK